MAEVNEDKRSGAPEVASKESDKASGQANNRVNSSITEAVEVDEGVDLDGETMTSHSEIATPLSTSVLTGS